MPGRPERPVQGQIGWLIPRSEVTIYHGGHFDLITGTGRRADLITGTGRLAPVVDAFLTPEAGEPQLYAGIHGATSQRRALADPSL